MEPMRKGRGFLPPAGIFKKVESFLSQPDRAEQAGTPMAVTEEAPSALTGGGRPTSFTVLQIPPPEAPALSTGEAGVVT